MKKLISCTLLCLPLALGTALSGCVPAIIGAGAVAATGVAQDRGLEQGVDDNEISLEIGRKLLAENQDLYARTATLVRKGRVMLIGYMGNPQDKARVEAIARTVGGITSIRNELLVGDPLTFSEKTSDTVISTKLRTALFGDGSVSSINYSIRVLRSIVYITGTAMTQAELDGVIAHARDVSGVHGVVSDIEVK